ncbi:MAG: CHASE2 domain-containing protein [Cyanobacteriota bacterium]|nr:CHASE2 domain-containing protein [Cyanobacteriota bacterium]
MRSKLNILHRSWFPLVIATPAFASFTISIQLTGFFQHLEWATYDRFFELRPLEPPDDRITLVTIDENDISHIGDWPLPDATLAQLIRTLKRYQPAAIGLDIYRNLPVEPGYQAWVEVMRSTPNLIGVEKGIGVLVGPPPILKQADRVALSDFLPDGDSKIRRILLSHPDSDGKNQLGLGAKLALMYLEQQGITLEELDPEEKHYRLGRSVFVPLTENDGSYIRTDAAGYQMLLNYRGRGDRFESISLKDVLDGRIGADEISGRIVLIGSSAPSLNDVLYTPYSSNIFKTPQPSPGVVIHANAISQIVSAALDGRLLIRSWSEPCDWMWILLWSGIGSFACWALFEIDAPNLAKAWQWTVRGTIAIAIVSSPIVAAYSAFRLGWWIPAISPLVAQISSATAISVVRIRQLQRQRAQLADRSLQLERAKIKAEVASEAKSQFLAHMSHELRTPLNIILGFTQLMDRDSSLNSQHREYLNIINRSGEHLLELIDDVLDLAKIEAGVLCLNESSVDLYRLIDLVESMFRFKADRKGLKFIVKVDSNVPEYIVTDSKKLRACIINLLANAFEFTDRGSIALRVALVGEPNVADDRNPDCGLSFEVEDTGPGIATEELDRLFDPFVQTQTGRNSGEGTGLGLAITQKFVQLLGGTITASSKVGVGTTFEFQIRVTLANAAAIESPAKGRVIGLAADGQTYRILVADDTEENCLLMRQLLEPIGFEVCEAYNGREAIAIWESWHPHLIWMDSRMPQMDGLEATRQIRSREGSLGLSSADSEATHRERTVILALSASAFEERREEILAAGCDDFAHKPCPEALVFEKMAQYLDLRYVREEAPQVLPSQIDRASEYQAGTVAIDQLSQMPRPWVQSLTEAANKGCEDRVWALIDEIPPHYDRLARELKALAHDFRLDIILRLARQV